MSTLHDPSAKPDQTGHEPGWAPLAVLLSGTCLVVLDFFIVNVALPSVQRDLHASSTTLEWLVAGYGLTFGGLLIAATRLGDRWSRRRMYASGVALFVLASAACGLATSTEALVVARLVQGVGAAMLSPMVLALVGDVYEGPRRARALAAYSTAMGLAAACGQLLGGVLIRADIAGLGWRSVFLVNVPVGLVTLALVRRVLPESRVTDPAPVDLCELVLATGSLTAVMLPLLEGRTQGWPWWTWACFALAAVLAVALVRRGRALGARGLRPLLDPEPFRSPGVAIGLLGQGLLFAGMASYFLVLAIYLQQGRGLGPLASGLVFSILAVAYLVGTRLAPRLVAGGPGRTVVTGAALFTSGHLVLLAAVVLGGTSASVLWLAPGLAVSGLGMGLCLTALVGTVMAVVPPHHAGHVSGASSTVQQVANALGVALVGIVFFGLAPHGMVAAFAVSLACLCVSTVGVAVAGRALGAALRPQTVRPASGARSVLDAAP